MKTSISFLIGLLMSTIAIGQVTDHLTMKVIFKDSSLHVEAEYYANIAEKSSSIYFLLNPGFQIKNIKAEGLTAFNLGPKEERPFPFWKLDFDRTLDKGEKLMVYFEYEVNLKQHNHLKSNWIELNADKMWVPNYNDLDNLYTYDVSISNFPDAFSLVGSVDASINRNSDEITIEKGKPDAEVLILAGGDMRWWHFEDDISLFGHQSINDSIIDSIHEKVKNSIDFFNEPYGTVDPIAAYTVVLRNTTRAELGYQYNRDGLVVTGVDFNSYGNLSHEIAHYWWNKASFIEYPWINESFANYFMYLATEKFAPGDYKKILDGHRKVAEQAIPVDSAQLFAPDSYNSYYVKGAVLLKELEGQIGEDKMTELLMSCIKSEVKTTEEFLSQVEQITDLETRNYFAELLKK